MDENKSAISNDAKCNYRRACSIQLEDTVIVTGGYPAITRVQEYNLQGSVARLPDLNTGRRHHACGHYTHNGQMVSTISSHLSSYQFTKLVSSSP